MGNVFGYVIVAVVFFIAGVLSADWCHDTFNQVTYYARRAIWVALALGTAYGMLAWSGGWRP